MKFLFDILNLAETNEIKTMAAKAKIDGCPRNKSKIIVFRSRGWMKVPILISTSYE